MIQFICEECGNPFRIPAQKRYKENLGEFIREYTIDTCPYCGCEEFTAADACQCGRAKYTGEILCVDCMVDLKNRFMAFADELTEDEEKQVDEWMDGSSITERRKWI